MKKIKENFASTQSKKSKNAQADEPKRRFLADFKIVSSLILTALIFFNLACTPRSLQKANDSAPATNQSNQTSFERDLETMRTADFEYIFVFRRKDGGAFDGEDKKFLKANSPSETNRFISTDDEKAFIAGSKYKFAPENLEALKSRFNVEDYSAQQAK